MARYYQKEGGVYDVSKDKMLDQPEAERIQGLSTSALPQFTKNKSYNPNDPASKRYVPSGEQLAIQPSAPPQVAAGTGVQGVSNTPEGIKAAFGEGWQSGDIFKGMEGVEGAVRIKGGQDVFTIGERGKWIETPEEYEKLFGTSEQAGIVGEITPEQAKLLGIRPEGVAELKAGRAKDVEMKNLFDMAQKAGLSWEETMNLIESQYPTDTTSIRDELGIDDVADKLFETPDQTIQEIYQGAYDESELPNIKDKIQDIDDQIKKARGDLGTATGQINANPWISESSRVGKMRVLNERAEETIFNLENQRSQYLDLYDKGLDELEGVMLRGSEQYERQRTLHAEHFNYLLDEAERRETEAREKRYSEDLLRYAPDWLKDRDAEEEDINTEIIKLEDGTQILINSETGEEIKTYGGEDNIAEGIVGGYNISRYATGPNHEASVASILERIGKFNTWEEMDTYIQQVAPGSPITGEMIGKASEEFGVSWEMMVAMMQQDSSIGTKGKGARTFNPGNVGNDDTGREVNYGDWQSGVNAVAKWLGKNKATMKFPTDKEMEELTTEERNVMQGVMRLLPTKLKDALQEKRERQKEVIFSYRQGKTFQTIADEFQGFIIDPKVSEEDRSLASNLRAMATGTDLDLRNISAPINLGQPVKAMTNVENANLAEAQGELKEVSSTRALIRNANRVIELLKEAPVKNLGAFDGRKFKVKKWMGLSDEETKKTQRLETAMVNLLNEIRRKSLGTAVTESEVKFLEPLLTDLLDQPGIVRTKVNELKIGTINIHNEARGTVNLPKVDEEQLINNKLRLNLYRSEDIGGAESSPSSGTTSSGMGYTVE